MYFEFCVNAMRNEKIKSKMVEHYQEWIGLLVAIFKQLNLLREYDDNYLSQTASSIIAILDGFHLQNSISPNHTNPDMIIQLILNLLHAEKDS